MTELASTEQVIESLIALLQTEPNAAREIQGDWRSAEFWQQFFNKNDKTRRLLEIFRELPAFSTQSPGKRETSAAWLELMNRDFEDPLHAAPAHAERYVRQLLKSAQDPKPKKTIKRWRDRISEKQLTQFVRPKEWNGYLHNPHRGTTTFQRFQGDPTYPDWAWSDSHGPVSFKSNGAVKDNEQFIPRTTLSYCRWPWATLEPEKRKYNWRIVDESLKAARKRGQTLQLRFQPYTSGVNYAERPAKSKRHPPECGVNVPDWYWDTGAKWIEQGQFAKHEPDSNDPLYVKHFGEFVRAFAKRYDGHPDLESVDLAYAGFWGEAGGNATPATARKLAEIYLRSFKKTQIVGMLSTEGCKVAAKKTEGTRRPVGWRADCFGDLYCFPQADRSKCQTWTHMWDYYPMSIVKGGVKERWQVAPVTMETCGNAATWYMDEFDLDVILHEGYRYHMSVFMPKSNFFPKAWMEKLVEFDKKIGYRYALRRMEFPVECKAGKPMTVHCFLDNLGCAPIYRPYAMALRFRQGNVTRVVRLRQDIRQWMPGHTWFEENVKVPAGLKKGEVEIDMVIVDDKNLPKVWWAIESRTDDGWHPLTSVDVI